MKEILAVLLIALTPILVTLIFVLGVLTSFVDSVEEAPNPKVEVEKIFDHGSY